MIEDEPESDEGDWPWVPLLPTDCLADLVRIVRLALSTAYKDSRVLVPAPRDKAVSMLPMTDARWEAQAERDIKGPMVERSCPLKGLEHARLVNLLAELHHERRRRSNDQSGIGSGGREDQAVPILRPESSGQGRGAQ